jgi:hypothetical protein
MGPRGGRKCQMVGMKLVFMTASNYPCSRLPVEVDIMTLKLSSMNRKQNMNMGIEN